MSLIDWSTHLCFLYSYKSFYSLGMDVALMESMKFMWRRIFTSVTNDRKCRLIYHALDMTQIEDCKNYNEPSKWTKSAESKSHLNKVVLNILVLTICFTLLPFSLNEVCHWVATPFPLLSKPGIVLSMEFIGIKPHEMSNKWLCMDSTDS